MNVLLWILSFLAFYLSGLLAWSIRIDIRKHREEQISWDEFMWGKKRR